MPIEERLVRCTCGREYNAGRLDKCPACGSRPGQTPGTPVPVEPTGVPTARVTTQDALPGFEIVRSFGVVTNLSANSGWTATSKGNNALDMALAGLRRTAGELGANAVVRLSGGPFGAHGGLTSGFGGDAVGILLMGTAVRVIELPHGYGGGVGRDLRKEALRLALVADPSLGEDDAKSLARLAAHVDELEGQLRLRAERDTVLAELRRAKEWEQATAAAEQQARAREQARLAADAERAERQLRQQATNERVRILSPGQKVVLSSIHPGSDSPGWHADPLGAALQRFWSGTEWTGRIRDSEGP